MLKYSITIGYGKNIQGFENPQVAVDMHKEKITFFHKPYEHGCCLKHHSNSSTRVVNSTQVPLRQICISLDRVIMGFIKIVFIYP
jgi:hypothetical protein